MFLATITAAEAGSPNVPKFLSTIAYSEGTEHYDGTLLHGYDAIVWGVSTGQQLFKDFSTHPGKVIQLNHATPPLYSTAAGRYQELYRNWEAFKPLLRLPDFGPLSQDKMAIYQLKMVGALPHIIAGDIREAIFKAKNIWASFPGSPYEQGGKTLQQLLTYYNSLQ